MAGFFHKLKAAGTGSSKSDNSASTKNKKEEPPLDLTPVERLLHNAGPIREDGSDKFFGLENFGNTCYCNSIVQALYHSDHFRENVVNYPSPSPLVESNGTESKVNVTIRPPPVQANGNAAVPGKPGQPAKPRQSFSGGQLGPGLTPLRPEDRPDAPEYKKKQAMIKGPVLELAQEDTDPYGMQECTFTGLKDIFTALIDSQSRTGVLSPQRFLDIFKRDNEMFRNSMHQDAHEFYGIVLNDVIANVEANAKRMQELAASRSKNGLDQSVATALSMSDAATGIRTPGTGWVHDIFEGVLTSETRCLACERASQRDETFLDLSIDLEEHSSVTSCLQKFSAEEMLCERNKFHCDHCGGLQEAEKRMKIKKLPKVLALHLKRFKYTEDYSRLQKLFHRVVYPYHLRMFNTTDDVEDPDRLYELYAVVVHIGGNAYHGHYVAIIKTKDRGWLLFDDEMVEPVDKHFVRNFFGDKPGTACAYVLFYQETTFERVREEMDAEGLDEVKLAAETADLATTVEVNGASATTLPKLNTQPLPSVDENDTLVTLNHSKSNPEGIISPLDRLPPPLALSEVHSLGATPSPLAVMMSSDEAATLPTKSKEEKARGKKELKAQEKAQEKARKAAEKEQLRLVAKERYETQNRIRETARQEREQLHKAIQESKQLAAEEEKRHKKEATDSAVSDGGGDHGHGHKNGFLNRAGRTSKTMTRKSFAFLNNKADKDKGGDHNDKTDLSEASDTRSDQAMNGSSTAVESDSHLQHHPSPHQNGNSNGTKHMQLPSIPPLRSDTAPGVVGHLRTDKDKPPLKERFSFSLGKRKNSKFFSVS